MFRKLAVFMISVLLLANVYGCATILIAGATGVGTAVWLSGKLSETLNASLDDTVKATKAALKSLDMPIVKDTQKAAVAQIISRYSDGTTVWIDMRPVTKSTTKMEIRVGVRGDKAASSEILDAIKKYLGPF